MHMPLLMPGCDGCQGHLSSGACYDVKGVPVCQKKLKRDVNQLHIITRCLFKTNKVLKVLIIGEM